MKYPHPVLHEYKTHLQERGGLAPKSVENYVNDVTPFIEYLDETGYLHTANPDFIKLIVGKHTREDISLGYRNLVRDYVSWLMGSRVVRSGQRAGQRGHQRASVIRLLTALKSFMRYAIEAGLAHDSAIWDQGSTIIRRFTPKLPHRLPEIISPGEATMLIEAPSSPMSTGLPKTNLRRAIAIRDQALLELLYGCGLRVAEISSMTVVDIEFSTLSIKIIGKGSKQRLLPVGKPAIVAAKRYLRDARVVLQSSQSGDSFFLNGHGGRLSVRGIQKIVAKYAHQTGLRHTIHPHTLRHSFATHLLDGGAGLREVQALLGHSTPTATQVYTHISKKEARKVYMAAHPLARASRDTSPKKATKI